MILIKQNLYLSSISGKKKKKRMKKSRKSRMHSSKNFKLQNNINLSRFKILNGDINLLLLK